MRVASSVLTICLLSLPTVPLAFGSAYPLAPNEPDISVSQLTGTFNGTNLTMTGSSVVMPDSSILPGGVVGTLIDVPGTNCNPGACTIGPALAFTANASGFTISGQSVDDYLGNVSVTSATATTYLSGTYISGSYINPGGSSEYGELFTITAEDYGQLELLEQDFPSVLGTQPATDWLHDTVVFDFDSVTSNGDLEPYVPAATPEPASLTLLCTGLAAGMIRKRLARKKA